MEYIIYIMGVLSGAALTLTIMIVYGQRLVHKRKKAEAAQKNDEWGQSIGRPYRNTLKNLRILNPARCKAFGHSVEDMPLMFWSTAVAGEAGELCNIIKKVTRGDSIPNYRVEVGKEAADVVIYLDLLCTKIGIRLEDYIIIKFNEVSDRVKSDIKL